MSGSLKMNSKRARELRRAMFKEADGRCWYCGTKVTLRGFTIDHVVPRAKGINNNRSNLRVSCQGCNVSKDSFSVEQFREFCGESRLYFGKLFYGEFILLTEEDKSKLRKGYKKNNGG
jgi:hypothetical protein